MDTPDQQPFTSKDHDLLIAINVKVDTFLSHYSGMDGRLKTLETIVDKTDPIKTYKEFQDLKQEFHDQQLTAATRVRMAAATASVITFILNVIVLAIAILTGILKFVK